MLASCKIFCTLDIEKVLSFQRSWSRRRLEDRCFHFEFDSEPPVALFPFQLHKPPPAWECWWTSELKLACKTCFHTWGFFGSLTLFTWIFGSSLFIDLSWRIDNTKTDFHRWEDPRKRTIFSSKMMIEKVSWESNGWRDRCEETLWMNERRERP